MHFEPQKKSTVPTGMLSKSRGQVLRIATILHMLFSIGSEHQSLDSEVSETAVKQLLTLSKQCQAGPAVMGHGRNVVLLFIFFGHSFHHFKSKHCAGCKYWEKEDLSTRLGKRPTDATSTLKRLLVQWNLEVHWKCLKHQYYLKLIYTSS